MILLEMVFTIFFYKVKNFKKKSLIVLKLQNLVNIFILL